MTSCVYTLEKTDTAEVREVLRAGLRRLAPALSSARPEARFLRVEADVEGLDALTWLAAQPRGSRGYWSDRDGSFELAGIGGADVLTGETTPDEDALLADLHHRIDSAEGPVRYFGGMRFGAPGRPGPEWDLFKAYRFILPRFEVVRRGGRTTLACNLRVGERLEDIDRKLDQINFSVPEAPIEWPRPSERVDIPDYPGWRSGVEAVLAAMASGQYGKVVLARASRIRFPADLNAAVLLARLKPRTPQRFHFCFQPHPDAAFVGASPERLYRRDHQRLQTEAIAGTCPRGATAEEDNRWARELAQSDKERREHAYVVDGITESLRDLCTELDVDRQPSLLPLTQSQHLITGLRGLVRAGVRDGDILKHLHPTPAVGGTPRSAALGEIARLEPFDRGWYAGPVGWVSRDETEFAVAIRSALVERNILHLYAGAGIVAGSDPRQEWDEVENKIGDMLNVIGLALV